MKGLRVAGASTIGEPTPIWRASFCRRHAGFSQPTRKASPAFCEWIGASREIAGGAKGVYHINAVDEVTQWQVVGATPRSVRAWLEPRGALLKA